MGGAVDLQLRRLETHEDSLRYPGVRYDFVANLGVPDQVLDFQRMEMEIHRPRHHGEGGGEASHHTGCPSRGISAANGGSVYGPGEELDQSGSQHLKWAE